MKYMFLLLIISLDFTLIDLKLEQPSCMRRSPHMSFSEPELHLFQCQLSPGSKHYFVFPQILS